MRHINWTTCIVVAAAIFVQPLDAQPQSSPQVDPVWTVRAASEGRAAFSRYLSLRDNLDVTLVIVRDSKDTGHVNSPHSITSRVVRLGKNIFFDRSRIYSDQSKPMTTVQCDNPDYHFDLVRDGRKTFYALSAYSPGGRQPPLENQSRGFHGEPYDCLKDVAEAAADQTREKLRALTVDPATSQLRVQLARLSSSGPSTRTIVIDPTKGWIVVAHRIETGRASSTTEYTYGKEVEGVLLPTGATCSETIKSGSPTQVGKTNKYSVKVLDVKRTELTPADFRLSAFGLPEPGGAPPPHRPAPWYVWLLTATGVSAALAVAFNHLRRRSQARRLTAETGG